MKEETREVPGLIFPKPMTMAEAEDVIWGLRRSVASVPKQDHDSTNYKMNAEVLRKLEEMFPEFVDKL